MYSENVCSERDVELGEDMSDYKGGRSTYQQSEILTPAEECTRIKGIISTKKLKYDEYWYVINSKWFAMWKDYVRYDEANPTSFGQRPDKINNEPLVMSESKISY